MTHSLSEMSCGAPKRGGHRDVDAGQGALLLGKVLLVAYLMESSNYRAQEQRAIEGDSRVPDCPRNQICTFIRHVQSTRYY